MQFFADLPAATDLPFSADPDQAAIGVERWLDASNSFDDELAKFANELVVDPFARRFLDAIFGNSPFLTQCAVIEPECLRDVIVKGPETVCEDIFSVLEDLCHGDVERDELARKLRLFKRRIALTVAVADLTGIWDLEQVTGALSRFAEGALSAGVSSTLR